jgi:hypothetical protein
MQYIIFKGRGMSCNLKNQKKSLVINTLLTKRGYNNEIIKDSKKKEPEF